MNPEFLCVVKVLKVTLMVVVKITKTSVHQVFDKGLLVVIIFPSEITAGIGVDNSFLSNKLV